MNRPFCTDGNQARRLVKGAVVTDVHAAEPFKGLSEILDTCSVALAG
jgi:hypothetical protein